MLLLWQLQFFQENAEYVENGFIQEFHTTESAEIEDNAVLAGICFLVLIRIMIANSLAIKVDVLKHVLNLLKVIKT